MILITGLAPGEERNVTVQGQYLYMDTVRVGGALAGGIAVPVTIVLESGRQSTYPLRSQDKISFGEGIRDVAVRNNSSQIMDVVIQDGWGNFSPRVELDAGTVTVEPGTNDLNVHIKGSDVSLGVVTVNNDPSNPVPVSLAGNGGGVIPVSLPQRVVGQYIFGGLNIDENTVVEGQAGERIVRVPLVVDVPPAGWRISGVECFYTLQVMQVMIDGAPPGYGLGAELVGRLSSLGGQTLPLALSSFHDIGNLQGETREFMQVIDNRAAFDELEFLAYLGGVNIQPYFTNCRYKWHVMIKWEKVA